jgi:hypothetical protein
LLLKKLLARRKKMKLWLNVRCARENAKKLWKRHVSSNSEKTKQRNADDNVVLRKKKGSLPTRSLVHCVDRRLFAPPMDKNLPGEGVLLGLVRPGQQRNRQVDPKVPRQLLPHQPSLDPVLWVVPVLGEIAKQPRPLPLVVLDHQDPHRRLYHPREKNQRRMMMDSKLWVELEVEEVPGSQNEYKPVEGVRLFSFRYISTSVFSCLLSQSVSVFTSLQFTDLLFLTCFRCFVSLQICVALCRIG